MLAAANHLFYRPFGRQRTAGRIFYTRAFMIDTGSSIQASVKDELERIEEDCNHSGKAHFNAASRWACWHYVLGIPSILLATAAGTAFFKDYTVAAGAMSSAVA